MCTDMRTGVRTGMMLCANNSAQLCWSYPRSVTSGTHKLCRHIQVIILYITKRVRDYDMIRWFFHDAILKLVVIVKDDFALVLSIDASNHTLHVTVPCVTPSDVAPIAIYDDVVACDAHPLANISG